MDPLTLLLNLLKKVLKEAIPDVKGHVYLRRGIPRQVKEVAFIQIALDGGGVELQDAAPPVAKRTRTVNITPVVRGDSEAVYEKVLALREQIIGIMREIQFVPGVDDGDPCLIDEIVPSYESAIDPVDDGEKTYTALTLSYEAVYVTEEGSRGEEGPGVPDYNVLRDFVRAVIDWEARRKGQSATARDDVVFQ